MYSSGMRITDQYLWNIIFTLFFLALVFLGTIILETEAYKPYEELTVTDFVLIALASFRFIRLVVHDRITAFFREQFWDAKVLKTKVILTKPLKGPRRTLADLLSCPWCFGLWASATVAFFYLLTPYAFFPTLFMALAGVATLLQLFANLIGWKAEEAKKTAERM